MTEKGRDYRVEVEPYALTAEEQVRRWDDGDIVWTIEMGGLGPGYEQALQIAAIEAQRWLCRNVPRPPRALWLGEPGSTPEARRAAWAEIDRGLDAELRSLGLGLSDAQAGAAKQIATQFWMRGPRAALEEARARLILVSDDWPRVRRRRDEAA